MTLLAKRAEHILGIIVLTYLEQGRPVASETIAERYDESLSSATIRNVMHELDELGFIRQPHTSAGRIPTDQGYRYYVDQLLGDPEVPTHVEAVVLREYRLEKDSVESLVERTSKMLSDLSVQTGFVMFPKFDRLKLSQVELTPLGKKHVLVVWVAENGLVQNQAVQLEEPLLPQEVKSLTDLLNRELAGLFLDAVPGYLDQKSAEVSDSLRSLYRRACAVVKRGFPQETSEKLVLEGSRHILDQPEFRDSQKSKRIFRVIENHSTLLELLRGDLTEGGVRVRIGGENVIHEMQDCAVVTARYEVNREPVGGLGVLGPTRMAYGRVISLVDFVARKFGEALEAW